MVSEYVGTACIVVGLTAETLTWQALIVGANKPGVWYATLQRAYIVAAIVLLVIPEYRILGVFLWSMTLLTVVFKGFRWYKYVDCVSCIAAMLYVLIRR